MLNMQLILKMKLMNKLVKPPLLNLLKLWTLTENYSMMQLKIDKDLKMNFNKLKIILLGMNLDKMKSTEKLKYSKITNVIVTNFLLDLLKWTKNVLKQLNFWNKMLLVMLLLVIHLNSPNLLKMMLKLWEINLKCILMYSLKMKLNHSLN